MTRHFFLSCLSRIKLKKGKVLLSSINVTRIEIEILNGDDDESFSENDNLQDELINNNTDKILNTNLPKGHSLVIAKKKRSIVRYYLTYRITK